jgi:hypothetical protein
MFIFHPNTVIITSGGETVTNQDIFCTNGFFKKLRFARDFTRKKWRLRRINTPYILEQLEFAL